MNKFILTHVSLFFLLLLPQQTYSQEVQDDFEGNGTINVWYGDACSINTSFLNPYQDGINTSETVMEYHDTGGQYANARFDINETFDLSSSAVFSLKIYVPSTGLTGNQTNQISLKLQDGTLAQPWVTQTDIIKPIVLDQWQTITFDFENDNYINFDPNSPPPIQRDDFNRVLIQVNGENNNDHVLAYIDDVLYDNSNVMTLLESNDRFEFWGLSSEQQAADVLMTELSDNYDRIADSLDTTLPHKIKVYVYQDLQTYHDAINWSDAPDWVVGNASSDDRIDMVTPYNPGPEHNYDSILLVVTHEMVHNFINNISNGNYIPRWLHEGTAVYLAEQHQNGFCSPIYNNNGIIPTLDELNNGNTFGTIGGYQITPTIAEFISEEFGGPEMLRHLIASGMNFSVLGLSDQQEFQDEWNQYVFINYPCNYAGLHAVFEADQLRGDYPLTVQFIDFSLDGGNTISSWNWDFDSDGTIDSNDQNPVWTFNQAGHYTISLTVDNGLETNTYTKNDYIEVFDAQDNQQVVFNKNFEDQNLTSGGWTAVNSIGDQIWTIPSTTFGHNDSYCVKISGYDNGAMVNEDWLISPSFSADANNELNLSFWNTSAYSGPNLELYWTNTYTGDPQTTNWNIIDSAIWHDGNTDWLWIFSGIIDLGDLSGSSVHLGFKYTSSEQTGAAAWEVDDILLTASEDYSNYFTDYDMFISKLNELSSSTEHAAELDLFWNQLIATGNFPFAIGNKVAFLYRGNVNSVSWASEFNSWDMNTDFGTQVGVSDIWILEKQFPSDTRLSYKIVLDGSQWITDEHNPIELTLEWGNSQLWMPDYVVPFETVYNPSVPAGSLSDNIMISSSYLGYDSQYKVYTPAGYNQLSDLPVVYVTDGQNFSNNTFGKMRIVMDNLIEGEIIQPLIAVFLDPRDPNNLNTNRRSEEYRNNIDFVNFITNELIPVIDLNYNTDASPSARAILGSSYGGYNSAYFCAKATNDIKNSAILSPIMHPNPPNQNTFDQFINDLVIADLTDVNIYMSYGSLDTEEEMYYNILENIFIQKGKAFESDIINDGHNFYNWNSVIGDALEYFFPAETLSVKENKIGFDFKIYPNPATDRVFVSIKEQSKVTLYTTYGQKVLEKEIIPEGFIDVAGLNKGTYLVLVENNSGTKTKKLIIK